MPTIEDYQAATESHAEHRGSTIIGASFIDDALALVILSRLVSLTNKEEERLFQPDGPLGTFSSKIAFGYALGIYGKITRSDLDIMRSIRNAFAHSKLPISFDTAEIKEAALRLQLPSKLPIPHASLAEVVTAQVADC